MKQPTYVFLIVLIISIVQSCTDTVFENGYIKYESVQLSTDEKMRVEEALSGLHRKFDAEENMITKTLSGYNYHTDADSGVFHEVRGSFYYAVLLLDLGDEQYTERAFDIIEKTITLQDQDTTSRSCGVWPYYLEEPLSTKISPIDYNWADFNAVSLLDVWMGHQDRIPSDLKPKIKEALILAAKSIQKRNMRPGYTNIAIMGAYVTYMVSNLFDLPEMKEYANGRLKIFYDYTLEKGGFSEYNSPTYTIVALDELFRMKSHIIEPTARQQIDSLYSIGWEIIARHYHKPTGQWAGPHSRSYSTLVRPTFYSILKEASNGKIDVGIEQKRNDVKIKHQIPPYLMPYFLSPEYPRTEIDTFENESPQTIGISYLTDEYALSTANRSSLWNQRRPFLLYWGQVQKPKYLQVRFLHDNYDFSSATYYSDQDRNKILAGINFISNGGDKHISIDRLKDGKFMAKDLRLRFEFGNMDEQEKLVLPESVNDLIIVHLDQLVLNIQLYSAQFDGLTGRLEKGGDETNSWIDLVFYSGIEKEFDLTKIDKAFTGFTFEVNGVGESHEKSEVKISETEGVLNIDWEGLKLETPVKPQSPENTFI
ncbi:MAG: hypothetical protein RIC06_00725 [Cyclobacteriaceae bacterium]